MNVFQTSESRYYQYTIAFRYDPLGFSTNNTICLVLSIFISL